MILRAITDPRFFPILIMVLFACAAVRYAVAGQWGPAVYWISALALNFAVTFMMGGNS